MSSVYFSPSNLNFKQQVAILNILKLKHFLTNSNQNWHKGIAGNNYIIISEVRKV